MEVINIIMFNCVSAINKISRNLFNINLNTFGKEKQEVYVQTLKDSK